MNAYAIPGISRLGNTPLKPRFDFILEVVSKYFEIPPVKIIGKSQKREIVICRQIIIYLGCSYYKNYSLNGMGKELSGRDHTTILYSRDFIIGQLSSKLDTPFKKWVTEIVEIIKEQHGGVEILSMYKQTPDCNFIERLSHE